MTIFNLDEYLKLSEDHEKSFHRYMEDKLFSRVNIKKTNTFLPDGQTDNPVKEGKMYEKLIDRKDGIDLMILGVGTNGHMGFNEPGTPWGSETRPVKPTKETRERNFSNLESTPKKAITIGIKTIMQAKKIILLASGERKTRAISKSLEGKVTKEWPASILQLHPRATVLLNKNAAKEISGE